MPSQTVGGITESPQDTSISDSTILSADEIKALCPSINMNINDTLIEEACYLMQETLLNDTLSQEFCEQIIFQKSGNTLTIANQYLWDNFIKYILAYGCWHYLVVGLSYQLSEAGLRTKVSDHSVLADSTDITYYRNYIQNFIDNKRESMNRYIRFHQDYPLYYSNKFGDTPSKEIYEFKIHKI